jgi:hypothetical protein
MKREKHLTIPPASSGSRGWMWVLTVGVGRVVVDPVAKTKRKRKTPHDPPHEQWLARLDVGAWRSCWPRSWRWRRRWCCRRVALVVAMSPRTPYVPHEQGGSRRQWEVWWWLVLLQSRRACHCHITTHPVCTPRAEGLVAAVGGVVVVGVIVVASGLSLPRHHAPRMYPTSREARGGSGRCGGGGCSSLSVSWHVG